MQTIITRSPEEAAGFIRRGGIVAFPTETVYGLGAGIFSEAAIEKIFGAKERPTDNPLIAHVVANDQIADLTSVITVNARRLIDKFFPGPLTLVLPKSARVPLIATAGLETIGVRMPAHSVAREFLCACDVPVAAPSANISGRPSPTAWEAVLEDLDGRIDCILQGEHTEIGLESTVVDCTGDGPVVLRKGAVSLEELQTVVPETRDASVNDLAAPRSPGMRHNHYSPRASVVTILPGELPDASDQNAYIGVTQLRGQFKLQKICASVEEYAHELFAFFRECDRSGVVRIFCETVPETGIGAALMDRIRRAADG